MHINFRIVRTRDRPRCRATLPKLMVLLNPVLENLTVVDKTRQGEPLLGSFNRANLVIARGCTQFRAPENFASFTDQTKACRRKLDSFFLSFFLSSYRSTKILWKIPDAIGRIYRLTTFFSNFMLRFGEIYYGT